ncbi:MAG: hypothetical protein KGO05_12655, partial [Chloroflexota bacterium]|nr:hypothetical protein [Chloroflexota bacterium]
MALRQASATRAPDTPDTPVAAPGRGWRRTLTSGASLLNAASARSPAHRSRVTRGLLAALSPALLGAAALILWQLIVQGGVVSAYLLPSPG